MLRPRLRRDLEFTHRRVRNVDEIIVCDPDSGGYFRAGELEAALFKLLDGETPPDEIASRLSQEYPDITAEDVDAFIAHLATLGFMEGTSAGRWRPPLYRRLIYAQLRVANPDRLFMRLAPYLGWLYRPVGTGLAAM